MADENNLTTLAKRLRPLMKMAIVNMGGGDCCFVCDVTNTYGGDGSMVSHTTATNDTAVGYNALNAELDGGWNTAVGSEALELNTSGDSNTAVGVYASYSNDSGASNTAIGELSLYNNVTGDHNVAVGSRAMEVGGVNTNYNVAIGDCALQHQEANNATAVGAFALGENTTGYGNVAVGYLALGSNLTGNDNIAVGQSALQTNTTGYRNIAIGREALYSNTDTNGRNNVAIGHNALYSNTVSRANIAIGTFALYTNDADFNVAIGDSALYSNAIGAGNTGIGAIPLYYNYDGDGNVAIGFQPLMEHTSGERNIAIGYEPMLWTELGDHNIGIGELVLSEDAIGDYNIAIGAEALAYIDADGKDIDDFSDYSGTVAGTVRVHSPGHGLAVGVTTDIRIGNSINYDGVYSVTRIDADYFYFTHAWSGNDSITNYCWWSHDLLARHNIGIGADAGSELVEGSDCVFLGYRSGYDVLQKTDAVNSMALGVNAYTTKDNQAVIGDILVTETLLRGLTGVNEVTVAAQLDVCQSNNAGAIPVLELDQDDTDDVFINFVGTSAADQTKSISTVNGDGAVTGPKNFSASAGWEYVGMVKIEVNGASYWMPYYQPDIA